MSEREAPAIKGALYAIYDALAHDLLGGQNSVQFFRNDSIAVRFFSDVLSIETSPARRHAKDHALVRLAYINDDHRLEPEYAVIITAAQLLAAQDSNKEK